MWIKVCGLTRPQDAKCCAECGVDAVGINLYSGPRRVGVEQAAAILRALPAGIVAGFAIAITFLVRVMVEERLGKESVVQKNFLGFEVEDALYVVAPVTWMGGLKWLLIAAATLAPVFMIFVLWQTWRGRNATSW